MERLEGSDVTSWERWGGEGRQGGGRGGRAGSEEVARWRRCESSEVAN